MRSFAFAFLCSFASLDCRLEDDVRVTPAAPELVEISLPEPDGRLIYRLPDAGWARIKEEGPFKGFLYGKDGRELRVTIVLKEDSFDGAVAAARAPSPGEIRVFTVGRSWPFVGIILMYRGPPDGPLVEAFIRSFRVERR